MEKFNKQKFTFLPVKSVRGEVSPEMMVSITKTGTLQLGNTVCDVLDIEPAVVIQLFADYEKRAIAIKVVHDLKLDELPAGDKSIKVLKCTINKKYGTKNLVIGVKRILVAMGYNSKLGVQRVEFKKYSDNWTKDVWYIKVPDLNVKK